MNLVAFLILASSLGAHPDSGTESIHLKNARPSEVMRTLGTSVNFQAPITFYGSDVDGTISVIGPESARNEFKDLLRMLDVPMRTIQIEVNLRRLSSKDDKTIAESIARPTFTTLNNSETEVITNQTDESYRLVIRPRINNDGTLTTVVALTRSSKVAADSFTVNRRIKAGERVEFGGIALDGTDEAKAQLRSGTIPQSGINRGIAIELTVTPK